MAYIDGKCFHTCSNPNCRREYFHEPDPVWGCLFMLYRPCGCSNNQLNLFPEPEYVKMTIQFKLEN